MKNFIKNAFLVILVVLLASTFLKQGENSIKSSLENDVIIVDKGEAIEDETNEDITYIEQDNSSNIFSKIGSFFSDLLFKIAELISKIIGSIFVYFPNTYLAIP